MFQLIAFFAQLAKTPLTRGLLHSPQRFVAWWRKREDLSGDGILSAVEEKSSFSVKRSRLFPSA